MKPNTQKLMNGLDGKSLYAAVFTNYLAGLQGESLPFSDDELTRAIDGLDTKPDDRRIYYRWATNHEICNFLQSECRTSALEACWQLALVVMQINHGKTNMEVLQRMVSQAEANLRDALRCWIGLKACGDALGLDIPILARREMGKLEQSVALYNEMADIYDDRLTIETNAKELVEGALPRLSFETTDHFPADCQEKVKDALLTNRNMDSMWSALDPLMDKLEG